MHSAFQIGGQSAGGGQGPRWLAAGQARLPEPPAIADRPGAAGAKAGSYSVIRVLLCGSWFTFRVCLSSLVTRHSSQRLRRTELSGIPTFYQLPFTARRGGLIRVNRR